MVAFSNYFFDTTQEPIARLTAVPYVTSISKPSILACVTTKGNFDRGLERGIEELAE